jgi:hypothetical protein
VNHVAINNIALCQDFDLQDSQLRRFWSLEVMGITDTDTAPHSIKDTAMFSSFADSFRIEDGRAVVSLPKKEHVIPADYHTNPQRRLQSLTRRFGTTTGFRTMYENEMLDYIRQSRSAWTFGSIKVLPAASRCQERKTQGRKMANCC